MTFQPNIPLATDLISISQLDLKNNFGSLSTAWQVNHNDFNASGAGKHKFVELPNQSSDPATAVSETTLFAKALSGVSRLYLREENSGTTLQFSGPVTASSPGSTTLLGGIVLKWGSTGAVSDNSTISFANAFLNNCWGVVLTIIDPNATSKTINVKTGSVGASSFIVRVSSGSISAFYVAIGN